MLLAAGRYEEARAHYDATLKRSPNRFNSLYGAGRAAELAGDHDSARSWYAKLIDNSPESSKRQELADARDYLAGNRERS